MARQYDSSPNVDWLRNLTGKVFLRQGKVPAARPLQIFLKFVALAKARMAPTRRRTLCRHPGCGKTVLDESKHNRQIHLGHRDPWQQPTPCEYPTCGKVLSSTYEAREHFKRIHSGQRPRLTQCKYPNCGETYGNRRSAQRHYREAHLGYQ